MTGFLIHLLIPFSPSPDYMYSPPDPLSASQRGGVKPWIIVCSPSLQSREGECKGVSTWRF